MSQAHQHAIVVTTQNRKSYHQAHATACRLFGRRRVRARAVSEYGYLTFLIVPQESQHAGSEEEARASLLAVLEDLPSVNWMESHYGQHRSSMVEALAAGLL